MSREAMKLAFTELQNARDYIYLLAESKQPLTEEEMLNQINAAITALRQALETDQEPVLWEPVPLQSDRFSVDPVTGNVGIGTPSQEPVAWANSYDLQNFDMKVRTGPDLHHTVPLYTAPPKQWVGLTALEVYECWKTGDVVEAVEAKLKEKNT